MKARANVVRGLGKPQNLTRQDPLVQEALMGSLNAIEYRDAVRSQLGLKAGRVGVVGNAFRTSVYGEAIDTENIV